MLFKFQADVVDHLINGDNAIGSTGSGVAPEEEDHWATV